MTEMKIEKNRCRGFRFPLPEKPDRAPIAEGPLFMMKKFLPLLALFLLAAAAVTGAEPAAPTPAPAATTEKASDATTATTTGESALDLHLYRVGRGFANLGTCFLEVPRCILLRNGEVPFWGAVSGAFEGVGCTGMRAFAGLIDVLFVGYDPGAVYHGSFRDFVWESAWLPPKEDRP